MIFVLYLAVALIVVFFSIKCADYVDMLDKKTDISGAFIGGVILAAVTSLPEMVTSISAIGLGSEELIVGNVLGSNLFNLCIFGILVLFTSRGFRASKVGQSHIITLICIMGAYLTIGTVLFTGIGQIPHVSVNGASFVLVVLYAISCRFMASDESESEESEEISLSLKQIVTRFVLCAFGLVLSSIAITYITDVIDETYNLGTSFAGAIFLGIATSIPELTSSISLVKKRNYNAMIGNVVGSCMFNFIIFSLADIIAFRRNAFVTSPDARLMVVFGAVSALVTFFALIAKRISDKHEKKLPCGIFAVLSLLVLVSYAMFLGFSLTNG